MPSWRSPQPIAMGRDCESATAGCASTSSPSSTTPTSPPTPTAASANSGPPPPTARSPAASVPIGAPTSTPPCAPSSAPPRDAASAPFRPSAPLYRANPSSLRVEQIPGEHRLAAEASGGSTATRGTPLSRQLQLPGRVVDQAAPCRGQGRVASGRAVSAGRVHRDQHDASGRAGGGVLQPARHRRAVDQGGQERRHLDAAVVPPLRRQRGTAAAPVA